MTTFVIVLGKYVFHEINLLFVFFLYLDSLTWMLKLVLFLIFSFENKIFSKQIRIFFIQFLLYLFLPYYPEIT